MTGYRLSHDQPCGGGELNIRFTGERAVHGVNDLSFSLRAGEVLGESGSGKSATLRALMRLLPKKRRDIGNIRADRARAVAPAN
jgi:ABC-type glutathione transport system ATPase component